MAFSPGLTLAITPAIEDGQTVDAWEVEHGPPQMTGKELAPFALGIHRLRSSSMMAMRSATVSKCWRVRFDGGEFAHGVERGNFKDAGSLGHGIPGVAVCLPPDEGRGERHNDADGMIMRAISDIVSFSCSKPVGEALKGEEVIER